MNDQHKIHPQLKSDLMIMRMAKRKKNAGGAGDSPTTKTVAAPPLVVLLADEQEPSPAAGHSYLYSASSPPHHHQREDEFQSPEKLHCRNYSISNNQMHETRVTTAPTSRRPPPLVLVDVAARPPASSSVLAVVHDGGISRSSATADVCGVSCPPTASGDECAGTDNKNDVKKNTTSMPEKASGVTNHSTTTSNNNAVVAKTKKTSEESGSSSGDTSTLQAAAALLALSTKALSTNEEQGAADKKKDEDDDPEEKDKIKKTTNIKDVSRQNDNDHEEKEKNKKTPSSKDDSRPHNRKKHHHLTASAILEMTKKIKRDKENLKIRPGAAVEDDSTSPGKEICPSEHDVLSGRGNGINAHPGNQFYRVIIQRYKDSYVAAPKRDKASFPSIIISEIESTDPPGRFLRYNAESQSWIQMPKKNAITKTRQVRSLAGCWKRVLNPPS